jgi:hypothetical protein
MESEKFEQGKKHLLWGITGLFIMLSMWGILIMIAGFTDSNIWFAK